MTACNCEYFGSLDVYDTVGKLAAGNVYRALAASATEQGGYTWLQFKKGGRTCYVVLLKDRVRLYTRAVINRHSKGIDVSQGQGTVNFEAVKAAGYEFALIRCMSGGPNDPHVDPYFDQNVVAAHAAGMEVGIYLCTRGESEAALQRELDFCLPILGKYRYELPVFLDYEDSSLTHLGKSALTSLAAHGLLALTNAGYYAGIYCNKSWSLHYLDSTALSQKHPFWLVQDAEQTDSTPSFGIWRYASAVSVPGVSGGCGVDYGCKDYGAYITSNGLNNYAAVAFPSPTESTSTAPAPLAAAGGGTAVDRGAAADTLVSAESASTPPMLRAAAGGERLFMRMQQKRAATAVWESSSLILLEGEIGLELDADNNTIGQKVGNGVDVWSALPYSAGGGHVIQDQAGTELPKEGALQFSGMEVTDDPAGGKTVVHGLGVKLADRAPVPGVPLHAVLKPVGVAPPVPVEGRADGETLVVDEESGVWSVAQAPKAGRLVTARKIGEAEFDGAADVTLAQMGLMTQDDMALYVSSEGNDSTGKGTLGAPYKTVARAIQDVPQIVNHTVTVNLAPGNYGSESISLGISGKGGLRIIGASDSLSNALNYKFGSLRFFNCGCGLNIYGVSTTSAPAWGGSLQFGLCQNVFVQYCDCQSGKDDGRSGLLVSTGSCYAHTCNFHGCTAAVYATNGGNIQVTNSTGNDNITGLEATMGGIITKMHDQTNNLGGTNATGTYNGGIIVGWGGGIIGNI